MWKILFTILFAALPLPAAGAQQAPSIDAHQVCAREFGDYFKLDPKFPPMTADLDNDGHPDLVLVATSRNPLAGEGDFHYRTVDPYDAYFGWGDPKVTVQFSATSATQPRYVLVVHNWQSPKAKFVIINLPFDRLTLARVARKKKAQDSIHAIETGGLASDVYWDGHKYKWQPSYIDNE